MHLDLRVCDMMPKRLTHDRNAVIRLLPLVRDDYHPINSGRR